MILEARDIHKDLQRVSLGWKLNLFILDTYKQVLWQTVKIEMRSNKKISVSGNGSENFR